MIPHDTDLSHPTHAYALDVVEGRIVAGPIVRAACKRHLDDLKDAPARGFVFSARKADHAINFFPVVLRLDPLKDEDSDGEPTQFHLGEQQKFIIGSLFGWIESNTINDKCSGYRRFRTAYVETAKGSGKALALDTLIPTPDGWVKMGDIKVGDRVYDECGYECRVNGATDVMHGHRCYNVVFDDGASIVADAGHLWLTEARRPKNAIPSIKTTEEISRTLRNSNGKYQSANHSIPVAAPILGRHQNLPIDPYVLGVWLGDGDSDAARITVGIDDIELLRHLADTGLTFSEQKPHNERCLRVKLDDTQHRLRACGLLGNKHIPRAYLRASYEQRMSLLKGLMDTDGYISKVGECEYTSVNITLAANVLELVVSLGMKASCTTSIATLYGKDCGDVFDVNFTAPDDRMVFSLSRKCARQYKRHDRRKLSADRRIVSCDEVESVPVRCISVDSPSRMFLAGNRMIPTHNSPLAAGIGMYGLIADGEHRAEIFSAAAKKDQAMIMFKDAVSFVEMSPPLSKRLKLSGKQPNVWNIYDEQTNSNFRPISSDEGQSGARPHIGLIDELHEHKSPLVVNMMGAGQKGRKQPLVFIITNSGSDKQTVCGEYHDKAERVAFGMEQDDRFFSYVCSLDKDDDPFVDEECWIKANPMLGITIQKQYIRDQIAAATMPSKQSDVKRLNFCIWTAADNPFIDYAAWNGALNKFDLSMFANHDDVALGLDLSQVRDLTAAVFSRKIKGHIYWWPEFWIPEAMVHEKTVEDKVPYETWVARGWVRTTPGNTISLSHVANDIKELMKTHRIGIQSAPYDRWRIDDFKKACDSVDLRIKDQLQEFGQGFKDMSPAIDAFERDLMNGYFHHPGNPCLDWCAANAVVISDPAGGRKLDKGSNQRKRIDGIIAGIMSHHATSLLPEQSIPSIRWM